MHSRHHRSLRSLLLASTVMLAAAPAVAADVTPDGPGGDIPDDGHRCSLSSVIGRSRTRFPVA